MKAVPMALKTKLIIAAVAAAAVAATAAVVINADKTEFYRVLKVFEMFGTASVERAEEILDAYTGMNLENGDMLSVDKESSVRISLDGDKYILLDELTKMELVAEGNASDSKTSINLVEGTILNEVTKPLSANSVYEVNTPKATMAVRGTSFSVSVAMQPDGSYITDLNTFNGKVAVQLIDENGNKKGDEVMVPYGKSVSIVTEKGASSASDDPAVDGNSFFVIRSSGESSFVPCEEGEDPVYDSDYGTLSAAVRERVLKSNDDTVLVLDEEVYEKLLGYEEKYAEEQREHSEGSAPDMQVTDTSAESSQGSEQQTDVSVYENDAESETENAATAVSENDDEGAVTEVTTVPEEQESVVSDTEDDGHAEVTEAEEEEIVPQDEENAETEVSDEENAETEQTETSEHENEENTDEEEHGGGYHSPGPVVPLDPPIDPVASFTVVFRTYDGHEIYRSKVEAGSTIPDFPDVPERIGYDGKWICGGEVITEETVVESDLYITADYTIRTYSVRFCIGSETVMETEVAHGQCVEALPEIPEIEGKTSDGWKYNEEPFTTETPITEDTRVYCVYSINVYTLTFILELPEGNTEQVINAEHGATLASIPEIPEVPGYIPGGWMYDETPFTTSTVITEDMTITCSYSIRTCTVTFFLIMPDSTETIEIEADYNTTVSDIPEIPDVTGYTPSGWIISETEEPFTSDTVIEDDMEVECTYTADSFVITFVADFDESIVIDTIEADYGTTGEDIDCPIPTEFDWAEVSGEPYILEHEVDYGLESPVPVKYFLWNWEGIPSDYVVEEDDVFVLPYKSQTEVSEIYVTDGEEVIYDDLVESGSSYTLPDYDGSDEAFIGWGVTRSGFYGHIKNGENGFYFNTPEYYMEGEELYVSDSDMYMTPAFAYTVTFINSTDNEVLLTGKVIGGKSIADMEYVNTSFIEEDPDAPYFTGVPEFDYLGDIQWLLEDGTVFSMNTPITDNITIYTG